MHPVLAPDPSGVPGAAERPQPEHHQLTPWLRQCALEVLQERAERDGLEVALRQLQRESHTHQQLFPVTEDQVMACARTSKGNLAAFWQRLSKTANAEARLLDLLWVRSLWPDHNDRLWPTFCAMIDPQGRFLPRQSGSPLRVSCYHGSPEDWTAQECYFARASDREGGLPAWLVELVGDRPEWDGNGTIFVRTEGKSLWMSRDRRAIELQAALQPPEATGSPMTDLRVSPRLAMNGKVTLGVVLREFGDVCCTALEAAQRPALASDLRQRLSALEQSGESYDTATLYPLLGRYVTLAI